HPQPLHSFPTRRSSDLISPLASGHQNPIRRIPEFQIVIRHSQPAIRIPSASRSDIEQSSTCLGENIATIDEVQFDLLSHSKRLRSEEHTSELQSPCNLV